MSCVCRLELSVWFQKKSRQWGQSWSIWRWKIMGRCSDRATNCPATPCKRSISRQRSVLIRVWEQWCSFPSRYGVSLKSVFIWVVQAKDELNETDERRALSLKGLRAVMKERAAEGDDLAKLVQQRFKDKPDSLLLRFLRARKFEVIRAHELMKGEQRPVMSAQLHESFLFQFSCSKVWLWFQHPRALIQFLQPVPNSFSN